MKLWSPKEKSAEETVQKIESYVYVLVAICDKLHQEDHSIREILAPIQFLYRDLHNILDR